MSNSLAMSKWAEPKHAGEWALRLFSPLSACILLLLLTLFITELRFDWAEQLLGRYLITTNGARPESGAIWEVGRQARTARKTLDQIVTDRQSVQNEARGAESLSALAAGIQPGQWVMLTPGHFRKLYLKLPPAAAREMIEPRTLLALDAGGLWDRTYCEKAGEGLTVYLLDRGDRVLRQLTVAAELLAPPITVEAAGALEERLAFRGRIHSAGRFFDTLSLLGPEVGEAILPRPELLLGQEGRIGRVGISGEVERGFVPVGFEISVGARKRVVVLKGRDWAVFRLQAALTGDRVPGGGATAPPLGGAPGAEEGDETPEGGGVTTDGDGVSGGGDGEAGAGMDGIAEGGARGGGAAGWNAAPDESVGVVGLLNEAAGAGGPSDETAGAGDFPDETVGNGNLPGEAVGAGDLLDEVAGAGGLPGEAIGAGGFPDETAGSGDLPGEAVGAGNLLDEAAGAGGLPDEAVGTGTLPGETVSAGALPGDAEGVGEILEETVGDGELPVEGSGAGDGSGENTGAGEVARDAVGKGAGTGREIGEEDIPGDATGWVGMPTDRGEP